ncbi:MAG: response regulator [Spirochaetales bacterium]
MYSLLVADDEEIERKAIRLIINRNCPAIDQVWDAENGRQVVEICRVQRPDILFLDIRMPGLSGLEAARELRKLHPPVRIVFLTAYHEFEYAHEAIQIGVDDFLLKPASHEQVIEVIAKVTRRLDQERQREEHERVRQDKLEQISQYFTNELLSLLIKQPLAPEKVRTYFHILGIQFTIGMVAAFCLDYDAYPLRIETAQQRLLLKHRCMLKVKRELEGRMVQFLVHEEEDIFYVLVLPGETSSKEYRSEAEIMDLFQSLAVSVRKDLGLPLRVGLSHRVTQPEDIHRGFQEARSALEGTKLPEEVAFWEGHSGGIREGGLMHRTEALIQEAREYIAGHFGEALTLEGMASRVRLSSFYFSKSFKQCTGSTFIDYLTLMRIKKAKELLKDPKWSVKEISVKVGYPDPNYFTRVFKRIEGVSPTEYRSLIFGDKEQKSEENSKT